MPKGKSPGSSIKKPAEYEALKNKRGLSKSNAAAISNADAKKKSKKK